MRPIQIDHKCVEANSWKEAVEIAESIWGQYYYVVNREEYLKLDDREKEDREN